MTTATEETHYQTQMDSPVGTLTLVATDVGLRAVLWPTDQDGRVPLPDAVDEPDHPVLKETRTQLGEYFAGERTEFDLPFDLRGTDFQRQTWAALADIEFGHTASYGDQAKLAGKPKAARAIGAAVGKNPLSIVLPCHRVVGASGSMTGFAGGIDAKRWLLDHESNQLAFD